MKKIKFRITANGSVELEVEGAEGVECDALTSPFEKELGVLTRKSYKDSFYSTEAVHEEAHCNANSHPGHG